MASIARLYVPILFATSPFAVLLVGVVIIASNLVWFIPTITSLRQSVSDIEKATVRIALTQINKFLDEKETMIKVGSQFLNENLSDKQNQLTLQKILKEDYGKEISREEAYEQGLRLVEFFDLLYKIL